MDSKSKDLISTLTDEKNSILKTQMKFLNKNDQYIFQDNLVFNPNQQFTSKHTN